MEIKTIENLGVYKVRYRPKPRLIQDSNGIRIHHYVSKVQEIQVIAKSFQEVYTKISCRSDFDSFLEITLLSCVEKI